MKLPKYNLVIKQQRHWSDNADVHADLGLSWWHYDLQIVSWCNSFWTVNVKYAKGHNALCRNETRFWDETQIGKSWHMHLKPTTENISAITLKPLSNCRDITTVTRRISPRMSTSCSLKFWVKSCYGCHTTCLQYFRRNSNRLLWSCTSFFDTGTSSTTSVRDSFDIVWDNYMFVRVIRVLHDQSWVCTI